MRTAFFILAERPSPSTFRFARQLASLRADVILVTDTVFDGPSSGVEIIHIADEDARAAGYYNSSPLIQKTPIAWDKALYVMQSRAYDFAWFCEDDVLFTSATVAHGLINCYEASTADLLCQTFFLYKDRSYWPQWRYGGKFPKHILSGSFLPLCRISTKLSAAVSKYVAENNSLMFVESLLPSLVTRDGMSMKRLPELRDYAFRHAPPLSRVEVMARTILHGVGILHPVKDDALRSEILQKTRTGALAMPYGQRQTLRAKASLVGLQRRVQRLVQYWRERRASRQTPL